MPSQPKVEMSRHDRIVYLFALGSGVIVGAAYFVSSKSIRWAGPALVATYVILTGAFLWWRRARNGQL